MLNLQSINDKIENMNNILAQLEEQKSNQLQQIELLKVEVDKSNHAITLNSGALQQLLMLKDELSPKEDEDKNEDESTEE